MQKATQYSSVKKISVAIRADASNLIGNGHVMRCVALADELVKSNCYVFFICRNLIGNKGNWLENKGYPVVWLPSPDSSMIGQHTNTENDVARIPHLSWLEVSLQQDINETLIGIRDQLSAFKHRPLTKDLETGQVDLLIVDHYAIDQRWHKSLYPLAKTIMVIDDLGDRLHACDYLLDQNLDASVSKYDQITPENCRLLLGTEFALLRREFTERSPSAKNRRTDTGAIKEILISMGGVDRDNWTELLIKTCDDLYRKGALTRIKLHVILTSTMPYLERINNNILNVQLPIKVSIDTTDISQAMLEADVGIGGAGTTSWERATMALPSIVVIQADNQLKIAKALEAHKAAFILESNKNNIVENLRELINRLIDDPNLYRHMAHSASQLCDGQGVARVINALIS